MDKYINVIENNTTTFNRDIIITDLEGNTKVVIQCHCTLTKGKSMSYFIDIIEPDIYISNKETFQSEVDKWIADAKLLAISLNIPFIV